MSTDTLRPRDCRHILKLFREIPADVIAEGREWYPQARALAEELAATYEPREYFADGEDSWQPGAVERAAAVIAVLSPRLNWTKNVELAKLAYESWQAMQDYDPGMLGERLDSWPGLKINAEKAFRILSGENADDVVKGPKVRQFWQTIVDPTDSRAVVIDRHAIDVAFGRVLSDAERGRAVGPAGAYDHLSQLYRNAARIVSRELQSRTYSPGANFPPVTVNDPTATITPAELQAITWTYWRRTRAANAKANRKTEGK